jgi:L-histidine N-alpha-methyltransferase
MQNSRPTFQPAFAHDVRNGLSSTPKSLNSKYFYDDEGSRLFQEIMKLPEYYLSGCETEIFTDQTEEIFEAFDAGGSFDLIELGAGDGTKTAILIEHFLRRGADISYSPIDISAEALNGLTEKFREEFPELRMAPHAGDYFRILDSLKNTPERRKVLLFLGSNIGNFSREASVEFFSSLRAVMNDNDLLFVGFDLQKDPHVIVPAYDDAAGVTAKFNLNLLTRINRELGGDFDLAKFMHYANYRPIDGSARSFLISREEQSVHIAALGETYHFDQWEAVFMEISQKYTLQMIEGFAQASGFSVERNFFDSRRYYCNSLWRPVPGLA